MSCEVIRGDLGNESHSFNGRVYSPELLVMQYYELETKSGLSLYVGNAPGPFCSCSPGLSWEKVQDVSGGGCRSVPLPKVLPCHADV